MQPRRKVVDGGGGRALTARSGRRRPACLGGCFHHLSAPRCAQAWRGEGSANGPVAAWGRQQGSNRCRLPRDKFLPVSTMPYRLTRSASLSAARFSDARPRALSGPSRSRPQDWGIERLRLALAELVRSPIAKAAPQRAGIGSAVLGLPTRGRLHSTAYIRAVVDIALASAPCGCPSLERCLRGPIIGDIAAAATGSRRLQTECMMEGIARRTVPWIILGPGITCKFRWLYMTQNHLSRTFWWGQQNPMLSMEF
eukprot:SAG22_NODE_507_length_9623_cov_11.699286_2_plen_254_part_00